MSFSNCEWWFKVALVVPWIAMIVCLFGFNPKSLLNIYLVFCSERYKTVFFFLLILLYPFLGVIFFERFLKFACLN